MLRDRDAQRGAVRARIGEPTHDDGSTRWGMRCHGRTCAQRVPDGRETRLGHDSLEGSSRELTETIQKPCRLMSHSASYMSHFVSHCLNSMNCCLSPWISDVSLFKRATPDGLATAYKGQSTDPHVLHR